MDIEVGQSRWRRVWLKPLLGFVLLCSALSVAAVGTFWNRTQALEITAPDALRMMTVGDTWECERAMAELTDLAIGIVEAIHRKEGACVRESKYCRPWLKQIREALDKTLVAKESK